MHHLSKKAFHITNANVSSRNVNMRFWVDINTESFSNGIKWLEKDFATVQYMSIHSVKIKESYFSGNPD